MKIELTTPDKPEIVLMADRLRIDQDAVVGKLLRIWAWADANTVDGNSMPITAAFLDRLTNKRGFSAAMIAVGWLTADGENLSFPNFERHNGKTAKARAESNRRMSKLRGERNKSDENSVTSASPKAQPEKRREEKSIALPYKVMPPTIIECQDFARTCMPADPAFAESVGRQFHGVFEPRHWMTQRGDSLAVGEAWKHRLRVMIEEEARKPRKGGPFAKHSGHKGIQEHIDLPE